MIITKREIELLDRYDLVIGIDEAGRGPWAGPVVVCAFVINKDTKANKLVKDSKKMTALRREKVFDEFRSVQKFKLGLVNNMEIDRAGIKNATEQAVKVLISSYEGEDAYFIIDGMFDIDKENVEMRNKADDEFYCVAAASVMAKVTRDNIMLKYSKEYPDYGFDKHKGYGTKLHMEALAKYGPCELHRKSFKPVREIVNAQKKSPISRTL